MEFKPRQQAIARIPGASGDATDRDCTVLARIPEARCYLVALAGSGEHWRVHEDELFHSRRDAARKDGEP